MAEQIEWGEPRPETRSFSSARALALSAIDIFHSNGRRNMDLRTGKHRKLTA